MQSIDTRKPCVHAAGCSTFCTVRAGLLSGSRLVPIKCSSLGSRVFGLHTLLLG